MAKKLMEKQNDSDPPDTIQIPEYYLTDPFAGICDLDNPLDLFYCPRTMPYVSRQDPNGIHAYSTSNVEYVGGPSLLMVLLGSIARFFGWLCDEAELQIWGRYKSRGYFVDRDKLSPLPVHGMDDPYSYAPPALGIGGRLFDHCAWDGPGSGGQAGVVELARDGTRMHYNVSGNRSHMYRRPRNRFNRVLSTLFGPPPAPKYKMRVTRRERPLFFGGRKESTTLTMGQRRNSGGW